MPFLSTNSFIEANDSLQRVLRAWSGKAGKLPNGSDGNMTQEAVQRCIAMDTIKQLKTRIRKAAKCN
jgi:hypothetical protein